MTQSEYDDLKTEYATIATFHKEAREICFYLRIKNYGKSGAKISNIEITPSLKFMYGKDVLEFLEGAILGPNQMIQFIIFDEKEVLCKNSYNIKLDYFCIDNKKKFIRTNILQLFSMLNRWGILIMQRLI